MSSAQQQLDIASVTVFSQASLGIPIAALSGGITPASAAWPAANDAIFIPISLPRDAPISALFLVNGTPSGNVDIGLYTFDGTKIVSSGSIAHTGTSSPQRIDISDTYLSSGRYFIAAALNNGTGTVSRLNMNSVRAQTLGVFKMASAFPLPATAIFASPTASFLPVLGFEIKGIY